MTITNLPFTSEELFSQGPQRELTGKNLSEIAFPLGGIGTGTISLSGKGELIDWEIFNRPNKGSIMPFSFFTLYAKREGEGAVTKILQAPPSPPYAGTGRGFFWGVGFGVTREAGAGVPHVDSCTFKGEYPFAYIKFHDRDLPVQASLEAYNPFIPLNDIDSGIPAAIFLFRLDNPGRKEVDVTLAANLFNAVGYPGGTDGWFYGDFLGKNVNRFVDSSGVKGIFMTSEKYPPESPQYGSLALTTPWGDICYQTSWLRARWYDNFQCFWDEFSTTGAFEDRIYGPSEEGQSDVGSIGLKAKLKPGGHVELPIYITWHFPNFEKYWPSCISWTDSDYKCGSEKPVWRNFYATRFKDALDAAGYVAVNFKRLYEDTRLFHDAVFNSTLPAYVLDAVSSQASVMRTTTCIRLEDGTFYGFEGNHADSACNEGSCSHLWNYVQTLAFLFPALDITMADADYTYNMFEDGKLCFRLQLPLGSPKWDWYGAADGQMGGVLEVYRDWKLTGDDEWLKAIWPKVKKALEYAWKVWDKDKDGVMEDLQHNTYDNEFLGPNTMMGSFYLGALRAAEEMAGYLGDRDKAKEYREVFEKGSNWMDENLFNGEFYIQKYDDEKAPKYQYGKGCLADQLVGQWFSHIAGLGYLFKKDHVMKAMESIFKYNWRTDFRNHNNCQRVFALNDEKGLLLCTWPRGERPPFPFPYSDEVWCGIEYQVASHLIYEGYVEEGLAIVRAVRERHDGRRRNPWNEFECGGNYARSMASWAVLTALAGFSFDMPGKKLGFAPKLYKNDFRTFWSTGSGWGSYSQKISNGESRLAIQVDYGELELRELYAGSCERARRATARLGARKLDAGIEKGSGIEESNAGLSTGLSIKFDTPVQVRAGERLEIVLE